ncbi:hypothetical protein [Sessilibacter corallicola]|uniref:hypothetical protein n=1 Tax=Sessilibacter corallicola TaxID=2904075 RepID=UPI001E3167C3|nr:hypothetical protein [Sessilibacter corallicola]MCE2028017.1 hypothetical protein [Sessilibacter corallicola]
MFDLQVKCRNGERYLLKPGFGTSTPASGGPSAAEAYRLLQLFDEHAQKQIYEHFFGVGRPIDPFVEQKEHPTGNGVSRPPLSPIAKNEDISLYAARYQFDSYSIDKPLYLAFISKRIVVNSAPLTNYENEALSGSLKVQIRQALYEIVNIERIEKAQIQANYQKLSTWKKFTAHTSATGEGLADAAWGLAVWAKDVGEVVVYANPVRKAYITTRNAIEAGGFSEEVLEQSHNEFVSGAKKELVDVLGFDPSTVTVEQLYAALGLAELIYADEPLFTLFTQFAKDYAKAQHSTEVAKIAGGGVFEIILTVVLAAVTGGAAVLAVMASKARLMKYFTKVGDLVMEYAKVLKRRKQILEESTSKSKPADFSDFATSDYAVPKEKAKESYTQNGVRLVDLPDDLTEDASGVYGYLPTEDSQFHTSKWPVDWTNASQVESARDTRLEYHEGLRKKREWVNNLRANGNSDESIARRIVDQRNQDRLSHYKTEDELAIVYRRNERRYGNKYGPTYESQLKKYQSAEAVIEAALRSNDTMDILTGIAKPKG